MKKRKKNDILGQNTSQAPHRLPLLGTKHSIVPFQMSIEDTKMSVDDIAYEYHTTSNAYIWKDMDDKEDDFESVSIVCSLSQPRQIISSISDKARN